MKTERRLIEERKKKIHDLKKIIFRYGVKNCDMVICQTNQQKNLLKQTLGKEGKIIKNLYPLQKIVSKQRDSQIEKILWVGRIRKEKRPEIFLKLAKCFPSIKFTMLGIHSLTDPNYFYKIQLQMLLNQIHQHFLPLLLY